MPDPKSSPEDEATQPNAAESAPDGTTADPSEPVFEPDPVEAEAAREREDEAALAASEPVDVDFEPVSAQNAAPPRAAATLSLPVGVGLAVASAIVGGFLGVVLDGPSGGRAASGAGTDPALIARLDAFDTRLKRLREAMTAAENQDGSGASPAAVTALNADIKALESALDQALDRVSILEAAGPSGEAGGGAALLSRLDELSQEAAETRRLAEEAGAAPRAQAAEIAELKSQVAGLVDLVSQQADALARVDDTSAAIVRRVTGSASIAAKLPPAAVLALSDLRDAAAAGRPFEVELDAFAAAGGPATLVADLDPLADEGASTAGELTAMFPAFARAARAAEREPASGLGDQIGRAVAGVVTVRRVDAPATDAAADIVVRAEARLERNELPAALAEMKRLQGPAAAAVEEWVVEAERRVAIDEAFARLEDAANAG